MAGYQAVQEQEKEEEGGFWDSAQEYASEVADTVSEVASDAWDASKPYVSLAADFTPIVGEAKGAYETMEAFEEGDYFGAGINAAATLLGVVPVLGDAAGKGLKAGAAALRKEDEVEETIEQAAKFVDEFGESKQLSETLTDTVKAIEPPKNTQTAYKLFRTKDGKPDEFFPLFVNADQGVPTGQWIPAEVGPLTQKGKVKSKIGELAYRPGWHSGDYASASHIGGKSEKGLTKPDYRPANQVWAEVEVPNDVDWQSVADSRASVVKSGPNKGKLNAKEAHITDQVPQGGHYRYKTNPNMQGNWIISGEMKVNKTLSPDEVRKVGQSTGIPDLPTLPEVIDQKKLKLTDLNDESVKELKKYYPEKLAELSNVEMNEGGLMSNELMEMNHGGLACGCDDCDCEMGNVGYDEVSGNPVPAGSNEMNVRDDIPAVLSDGEYVVPADVVRYHGLKTFMSLRDEAKMGLMMMQAEGQIKSLEDEEEEYETVSCPTCEGTGMVDGEECEHCEGYGYHYADEIEYEDSDEEYDEESDEDYAEEEEEYETPEGNKVDTAVNEVVEEFMSPDDVESEEEEDLYPTKEGQFAYKPSVKFAVMRMK